MVYNILMAKLSVAIAAFNEEENIGNCLKSVRDFADEIILVDGGSVDKTVAISKSYNAKVILADNPPNFHINKQKAIDAARMEWVLQLDADEIVSKELGGEIRKVIASGSNKNGYWIPRKNYFLGRFLTKGGQYPDYTLRLYRKNYGRLPQKSVHEQAEVNGETGYLTNPLIHIADKKFSRYLTRFNRYTDLFADEIKQKDKGLNPLVAVKHIIVLPTWWFFLTYIRHKGFLDYWQGFVFFFFFSLRFPVAYLKYLQNRWKRKAS